MNEQKKSIGDMFDGDKTSYEYHIILTFIIVISYISFTAYSIYCSTSQPIFEPSEFGEGIAYILGGAGMAAGGTGVQRKFQRKTKIEEETYIP